MKSSYINFTLKNLLKQRNALLVVTAGLALSNLILVFGVINSKETVILVPPEIKQDFSFRGGSPSESYLEEMSLFFTSLVLDNSEASFSYKSDLILKYASPECYGRLKKHLMDSQERYKNEGLTTHFRPTEIKVNAAKLFVTIVGEMDSFVAGTKVTSSKETYCIEYKFQNGFLSIVSFKAGEAT